MKKARAWATLCLLVGAASALTSSCGGDEATGAGSGGGEAGAAGSAGVTGGGTSGTGGTGGTSGTSGTSGTTGGTGGTSAMVGTECASDDDCGSLELGCWPAEAGPPGGMCTAECVSDADCQGIDSNSVCLDGLCFEGCVLGSTLGGKCDDRLDQVCFPAAAGTGEPCSDDSDCNTDEFCGTSGQCFFPVPSCLPLCGGDFDCPSGTFCDPGGGICVEEEPTGLDLGEDCDPEDDQCQGFCWDLTVDDEVLSASCSGYCTFGRLEGCGWDGAPPADAACIFPYEGPGDVGFCASLCDCDGDCASATEACRSFEAAGVAEYVGYFGREGYCVYPFNADDEPIETLGACEGGGEGGAGGEAGAPGAAGEPGGGEGGAGGEPGGEGGAGGEPSGASGAGGAAGAG